MRGKVKSYNRRDGLRRITPAHAGKSRACARGLTRARDHPRACGEKWNKLPREIKQKGSPPRMRGKALLAQCWSACIGITPAHAGKSPALTLRITWLRGSPPRMRGKVPFSVFHGFCAGITPAHAGKRFDKDDFQAIYKDHPRACGEKS